MWTPPFFTCGECGGEIGRWPMSNMLRQDILDWRHRSVPDGTAPHRAVLGTPVPLAEIRLSPIEEDEEVDEAPDPVPAPELLARPAMHGELPSSAAQIDKLAAVNGWAVEAWIMRGPLMDARWKFRRVISSAVLRMVRDRHGLVAIWDSPDGDEWSFDSAWSLVHHRLTPLSSPELRAAIKYPRMICEDCGEPPALHVSTPGGLICHAEATNN